MKLHEHHQGFMVILGENCQKKRTAIYALTASERTGWLEGFTEILCGGTSYL